MTSIFQEHGFAHAVLLSIKEFRFRKNSAVKCTRMAEPAKGDCSHVIAVRNRSLSGDVLIIVLLQTVESVFPSLGAGNPGITGSRGRFP